MIRQLAQELRGLVSWWWTCDRIRVSPAEGRFLQIQPGDLLTLGGIDAEVLERHVMADQSICLTCQTPSGSTELHVQISQEHNSPELIWRDAGNGRLVRPSDVQVWSRGTRTS